MESAVCRKSMFDIDKTLLEGCSCEAKSNAALISHASKIGSQHKLAFGVNDAFCCCLLQNYFGLIGVLVILGHHQAPRPGSAPLASVPPPQNKNLARTRRHSLQISSICHLPRDDTRIFQCAFGEHKTLGGKRRCLTMCV